MNAIACSLAVFILVPAFAAAQTQKLAPTKTWKGTVADEALEKAAPKAVVSQKALDALWASWSQTEKAPTIDFKKEIVVVTTSRGSVVNLIVTKKEKDLSVSGFGTRDLRPGFRFVAGSIPREGIETINGEALPKE